MRSRRRRWIWVVAALGLAAGGPMLGWAFLQHRPGFYRRAATLPPERRRKEAREFLNQSLQLRNDIINESTWEAAFSDEEVNSWLAEDLATHFADQIPPGVRDPRVEFEPDRVKLAFLLDSAPFHSVVWAVLQVRVPEPNVVALTVEKIRAGALPVPPEQVIEPLMAHARRYGVQAEWQREEGLPVVVIRYEPSIGRRDVRLDQIQFLNGLVRLSGFSEPRSGEKTTLRLPGRKVLQSTFPRRSTQPSPPPADGPVS